MQCTDDSGDMVLSEEEARLRKEAVAWVIRLHSDTASPEDRRAFADWQAKSPEHALMFWMVFSVWDGAELRQAAEVAAKTEPLEFKAKLLVRRRWSILAATCATLLFVITQPFDLITRWQADYRTEAGEQRIVELPDRSIATLNTQSAIALSFDGTARRIRLLKGEAHFEVQQDLNRPFLVESGDTTVRATGTAFIVRTEPKGSQVTVIEGTVEVSARQEAHAPTPVASGSQVRMEEGRLGNPYNVNVSAASAWLRGRLVVDGVPFATGTGGTATLPSRPHHTVESARQSNRGYRDLQSE
ncbi:MAG: FecR domain-containing protein [Nitrospira sp.]